MNNLNSPIETCQAQVAVIFLLGEGTGIKKYFLTIKHKTMSTFKERLLIEKAELDEKRTKLDAFQNSEAFQKIAPVQMSLLNIQASAMLTYSQCLLERIAWLEQNENAEAVVN